MLDTTYKAIDVWLGEQSTSLKTAIERARWSYLVYASDSVTEVFNWVQLGLVGKRNQWLSRVLALIVMLPWWVVYLITLVVWLGR